MFVNIALPIGLTALLAVLWPLVCPVQVFAIDDCELDRSYAAFRSNCAIGAPFPSFIHFQFINILC